MKKEEESWKCRVLTTVRLGLYSGLCFKLDFVKKCLMMKIVCLNPFIQQLKYSSYS